MFGIPSPLALDPLPKREILGINLLSLTGYPIEIVSTPTKAKAWQDFFEGLKAATNFIF
jgi:hypothetical protein